MQIQDQVLSAPTKPTSRSQPKPTHLDVATEGFVLLAMALATLAIGTSLYLQFGLGFGAAMVTAASVFLGLLATHALVHRNSAVSALRAELSNLEQEFSKATGLTKAKAPPPTKTAPANQGAQPGPTPPVLSGSELSGRELAGKTRSVPSNEKKLIASTAAVPPPEQAPNATPVQDDGPRLTLPPQTEAMSDAVAEKPSASATSAVSLSADTFVSPSAPLSVAPPPREADVEMIRALIKKLADDVNTSVTDSDSDSDTGTHSKTPQASPDEQTLSIPDAEAPRTSAKAAKSHDAAGPSGSDAEPDKSTGPVTIAKSPRVIASGPRTIASQPPLKPLTPEPSAPDKSATSSISETTVSQSVDALRTTADAMRAIDDDSTSTKSQPSVPTSDEKPVADLASDQPLKPPSENAPTLSTEKTGEVPPATNESAQETHNVALRAANALMAGRVDVLLDPILGLENRRARHFEISLRLRDADNRVIDIDAGDRDLDGTALRSLMDRAGLSRTAKVALQLENRGRNGALFSNVTGASMSTSAFVDDIRKAFDERAGFAGQLVITLTQAHVRALGAREWSAISDLQELGFRFAISSVSDLDMDFEDLVAKGFAFAKLDADVFLNGLPTGETRIPADDICSHLAGLGLTLIVGRIDDDKVLAQIFGFGVLFGQGQLFGGPRTVKAQAIGKSSKDAAA